MIKIGPAGNSKSFYDQGHSATVEAPEWLFLRGLNAFEYSFGRGVNMSPENAGLICQKAKQFDIVLSVHAPYYTNFCNPDDEKINKSIGYVQKSLETAIWLGAKRVVVHPGSLTKQSRIEAAKNAKKNIALLDEVLSGEFAEYRDGRIEIAIETLGKSAQIGTVDEVLDFVAPFKAMTACIDFGHVNSITNGSLKSKDDFKKVIDKVYGTLGDERAKRLHIHFSKIMYGKMGEIKHLTFEDTEFGPNYEFLAEIINEYKMTPTLICESDGTMAEDAIQFKKWLKL
ncbi:MAG: TIM barrel protein [Firmicutes bacterium]|nr:TIM barrel protein [Bacillota bacterium]